MPLNELPPELLIAILSHLGDETDTLSLRACALTCRVLAFPAQANLFRTISLSSDFPLLLAKLESTPHIRKFVKRLSLKEIHKPWIQSSEALHRTLDLVSPYVVSLEIMQRARKAGRPRFDYSALSRLECLEEISLREENMTSQDMARCNDNALPTFLNQFPKLQALTFDQCFVENTINESKIDIPAPVFRLKKLNVEYCYDALALDWLLPSLSSLQSLHVTSHPSAISSTFSTHFMVAAAQSLQHLEMRHLDQASGADLKSMMSVVAVHTPNLRLLTFMDTAYTSEESPVTVLVECLVLIDALPHLQQLTLGFYQRGDLLNISPWDDLQDVLLKTSFPSLRSVEFCLLQPSPESIPISTESILAAVPRLVQQKTVLVRHS